MENVSAEISGQSGRRSRSSSRRFVRKRVVFEGPVRGCGVVVAVAGFTRFGGGIRKFRDLARDMLLVEDDILYPDKCSNTVVAFYCGVLLCVVELRRSG